MANMDWLSRAKCRGMDRDIFFPKPNAHGMAAVKHAAKAKAVCRACPVRWDCLRYAVENSERIGIYGGVSFSEKSAKRQAAALLKGR